MTTICFRRGARFVCRTAAIIRDLTSSSLLQPNRVPPIAMLLSPVCRFKCLRVNKSSSSHQAQLVNPQSQLQLKPVFPIFKLASWLGAQPPCQHCKLMKTCQENLDHYQLKHCQNQIAFFTMRCTNAISKLYQNWFDSIDSKFCIF